MKSLRSATMLFLLVACKGSSPSKGSAESTPPPAPAPAPSHKAAERADADPDFLHVDRDQLSALCLAARLPPVTYPSDYGALSLADGARVPWLTVWVDDSVPTESAPAPAKEWMTRARDHIRSAMSRIDGPRTATPRTGNEWRNIPCDGSDEAFDVVTTGVVFEKKSFHAFAMRGDKLLQQELPATTQREAVFRKAFELTETLVGQPATIATHKLFGSGEQPPTVTTDAWVAAATKAAH